MFMPSHPPMESPVNLDHMPREVLVATLKEVSSLPSCINHESSSDVRRVLALQQLAVGTIIARINDQPGAAERDGDS